MIKSIPYKPSEKKKEHYKELGVWLREHPQVAHKRLSPYGFSIDISTVPESLVDEFIALTEFKE